jgi:eukaryotic-like serine/threonine-protein kinase
MALASGTRVGVYEIADVLGRGGMGEVYRARDTRLDRTVALKILPADVSRDSERLFRFEREARLASNLNHPNIVVIYDIGNDDGVHYIAMEHVEGETLFDLLRKGPPAVAVTADLAYQIADALARAHAAGVIHRDLKPSNIMVTPERRAKVLDFGLGKLLVPGSSDSNALTQMGGQATTPGVLLGTAAYMSPEQGVGGVADARSDQFAFGLILYELLTATHPFARASGVQTLSAIIEDEAEPLVVKAPKTPEALALVVERCLAKAPADRFDSTADLARALQDICDHLRSGRTLAPITRLPAPKPARRWAWSTVATIAFALAALVLWRYAAPPPTSLSSSRQVALLPFTNVGGDPANQALADGLAEFLTTRLTQLERFAGGLQVVPSVEVRQLPIQSATEARRAFGVNLVVSGSLQRSTDRLLLTLNLIDGTTLRQIRADAIELEGLAPIALQEEVLVRLARLLDLPLDSGAQAILAAGGTRAPGAYDYYLQGRGYLQRFERAGNVDSAIELFGRALSQDPQYALAHAAMAEAAWRKYEATKDASWVARAKESGATALKLSPTLSEVQITLAIIANGTGEYENAVATLNSVLERDPINATAYRELGNAYDALGDTAKAESTFLRAVKARPGDWSAYNSLGGFYARHQRHADAAAQFERVVALTPDNPRGYTNLGGMYLFQRQWDKALPALETATKLGPSGIRWSNLATAYFRQQRYADAAQAFEHATEMEPKDQRLWYNLASMYLWTPGSEAKARAAYARCAALGEDARKVNARDPALFARLATCYAHLGEADKARAAAADAEKAGTLTGNIRLMLAQAFEQLGDRAQALAYVKAAMASGVSREEVESTRSLDSLRKDPAYAATRQ